MGRPAKPIDMQKGHINKDVREYRKNAEKALKGDAKRLVAPRNMPKDQKKYFDFFVKELKHAEILGRMDMPLLTGAARCFARLDWIEKQLDEEPGLLMVKETSLAQDRLFKQSMRYMNELGLSPASREKLAIRQMENNKNSKTIGDILNEDNEE